ncbi:MAG: hypothetical protein ACRCVQ_15610 [Acinetobacter ursingii]
MYYGIAPTNPKLEKKIRETNMAEKGMGLIQEIYKGAVLSKNQKLIDRLESYIEKQLDILEIG